MAITPFAIQNISCWLSMLYIVVFNLLIPFPDLPHPHFLLSTGNPWYVLCICESVSVLLYMFLCFIF